MIGRFKIYILASGLVAATVIVVKLKDAIWRQIHRDNLQVEVGIKILNNPGANNFNTAASLQYLNDLHWASICISIMCVDDVIYPGSYKLYTRN